jgi:hypothetical protein
VAAKKPSASSGVTAKIAPPIASTSAPRVRVALFLKKIVLIFEKASSIGENSGE